jgi:hypothetical protein
MNQAKKVTYSYCLLVKATLARATNVVSRSRSQTGWREVTSKSDDVIVRIADQAGVARRALEVRERYYRDLAVEKPQ